MDLYVVIRDTKFYLGHESTMELNNVFIDVTDNLISAKEIIDHDMPYNSTEKGDRRNCSGHIYEKEARIGNYCEITYYVIIRKIDTHLDYENLDLQKRIKKLEEEVNSLKKPASAGKYTTQETPKPTTKKEEKSNVRFW